MNRFPADTLLRHARREALVVAAVWLCATAYTLTFSSVFGYAGPEPREVRLVFGFPFWVFWGIVVPWVFCVVFGIWFSYCYMRDDDVNAGAQVEGESAAHGRGEDRDA
jgi:hypothetical protein